MSDFERQYGAATTVQVLLLDAAGLVVTPTLVTGDVKISKDGGALANIATLPDTYVGKRLQVALATAELEAAQISIVFEDQGGGTDFVVDSWLIETYGHASAQHKQIPQTGDSFARLGAPAGASHAADMAAAKAQLVEIETDTQNIQSRVPAALSGGRMITEAQVVGDKTGYALTAGEREAIANEVEAEIIDETDSEKVLEAITNKIAAVNPSLAGLTLSAIAAQVRTELAIELARIDAAITTRATPAQVNAEADQALADVGLTSTVTGRVDVAVSTRATPAQVNTEADTALADAGVNPTTMGRLDVAVSSRSTLDAAAVRAAIGLASANVDTQLAALDALIDIIIAKTNLLPAAPAAVGDIPTAVQNADALLGRSIQGGANGGRTVTSALRRIRNRLRIAAGVLTAYQEDDTTPDHTAAVTTSAGNPISEIDPV